MPLLLLLAATSAVIAGSTACAARLERECSRAASC